MAETAINLNQEIESRALALPEQAKLITVTDNDSMEIANNFNLDIRDAIKQVNDFFEPLVSKANEAHKALTARRGETLKPLKDASEYLTNQVKRYQADIRRKQEEEEARLREQARKEEEERRIREAAELEAEGRNEEAEEILEAPITPVIAPVPIVETPKVDGRLYRTQTKVKVTNWMVFLSHVKPETLIDCLNESTRTAIEAGLSRKAKALGRAFAMQGCQVIEQ